MNQRRLLNGIFIALLVILIGIVEYWGYMRKPATPSIKPRQSKEESIRKPVIPSEMPPQPTDTDGTKNWKTYRNEKYGFEVRYQADYIYEENPINTRKDHVGFWSGEDQKWKYQGIEPTFTVVFDHLPPSQPALREWIQKSRGCSNNQFPECEVDLVSIGGHEYLHYFDPGHAEGTWHYVIQAKTTALDFQVHRAKVLKDPQFFQILSTLRWEE